MERQNPFLLFDPAPLPKEGERPLEVALVRGSAIESRHRVHVAISDPAGELVHRWGNKDLTFFPRSAVKMIQAATWLSRGLERGSHLKPEELSIACASHAGEPRHIAVVENWLKKIDARESDFECGAHLPYNEASAHALIRAGKKPGQIHNNCSGKHSGFLTFCRDCGWDTHGYTSYDHPVQAAIRETFAKFLDVDMERAPWGIDGCGIPTYSLPLEGIAKATAKLADPSKLDANLGGAIRALNSAVAAEPFFIGGTDSFCSKVVAEFGGKVFAKLGAEGVYTGWIPQEGLGIALKCEDGSSRASEAAMAAVFAHLGYRVGFYSPLVKRWTGELVGQLIVS